MKTHNRYLSGNKLTQLNIEGLPSRSILYEQEENIYRRTVYWRFSNADAENLQPRKTALARGIIATSENGRIDRIAPIVSRSFSTIFRGLESEARLTIGAAYNRSNTVFSLHTGRKVAL